MQHRHYRGSTDSGAMVTSIVGDSAAGNVDPRFSESTTPFWVRTYAPAAWP